MREGLKEEGSSERTRSVGWLCAAAAALHRTTALTPSFAPSFHLVH